MTKLYLRGIGMMIGMIFGAGVFALPFSFSQAGLFWGAIHFIFAILILIFLHYLYGEVAYFTRGRHRFTGYTEIFLGKQAKQIALLTTIGAYYGSLLVYGLLGGIFLANFLNSQLSFSASLLFFLVAGAIVFLNLSKIADINFYLTLPLVGFVVFLFFFALPSINIENYFVGLSFSFHNNWFLPYGIWLFSLSGFASLPEVRDIFDKAKIKDFKRVILISLLLCAFIYWMFVLAVWGVSGVKTSEDALAGISEFLGRKGFLLSSLLGLLAVFTSFVALATDMKNIFRFDYGIPKFLSGTMAVVPPVILFLLGAENFPVIISIIGAVGLGILGIFIILMARRLRERIKEGDPGDLLKPDNGEYTKPRKVVEIFVLLGIIAGVIYELWRIFV